MHRTQLARWRYPFNPAAKCEYSNNTLEPSACISGQVGKVKIYTARVMSSSPHLGSPFELLIELLVAMGRDLTTRETLDGWDLTTGETEPKTGPVFDCRSL